MAFIDTIAPSGSEGAVREMYEHQQAHYGYVPNYAKVFSHRPEVMARWGRLLAEIRRPIDDRMFELATFAAAHELRNTACALAHGAQLARFLGEEAVVAVANGAAAGAITEAEEALVAYARKAARDASSINQADVDRLKDHGYTDAEVFDIAAAVAGRSFLTKILDALGVQADVTAMKLDPAFREPLTVGRPVADQDLEHLDVADDVLTS
jgi:uncharacterized peroxidase-related enzyme